MARPITPDRKNNTPAISAKISATRVPTVALLSGSDRSGATNRVVLRIWNIFPSPSTDEIQRILSLEILDFISSALQTPPLCASMSLRSVLRKACPKRDRRVVPNV